MVARGNAVAMAWMLTLGACVAPPDVARSPDEVRAAVARSGAVARTLYAELAMGFRSPERDASTSAVLRYRAPDTLRLTAFVDVVLDTRPVFDLVIDGGRYTFVVHEDGAAAPHTETGETNRLAEIQPMLAGFHWTREGLFFPGAGVVANAEVGREGTGMYTVEGGLSTGARATWVVDGASLDVVRARVHARGETFEIEYAEHGELAGRRLPRRTTLVDKRRKIAVTAVVSALELEVAHEDDAFAVQD